MNDSEFSISRIPDIFAQLKTFSQFNSFQLVTKLGQNQCIQTIGYHYCLKNNLTIFQNSVKGKIKTGLPFGQQRVEGSGLQVSFIVFPPRGAKYKKTCLLYGPSISCKANYLMSRCLTMINHFFTGVNITLITLPNFIYISNFGTLV